MRARFAILGLLTMSLGCARPPPPRAEPNACDLDFAAARQHIEHDYAGYADKRARLGEQWDQATRAVEQAVRSVQSEDACDALLAEWVKTFRDGHLSLWSRRLAERRKAEREAAHPRRGSDEPSLTLLGTDSALLRLPSFDVRHRLAIEGLMKRHASELRRRDRLIIDVRGNGGGGDSCFAPVLPLLYTQPIRVIGVELLATPANASAWERVLSEIPQEDVEVRAEVDDIIRTTRAAPDGTFFSKTEDRELTFAEVLPKPSQIAFFIDAGCKSACEQFVLEAKQSRKVRLIGTNTGGVLDYSNMVPHPLPSPGGRVLLAATSRSRRVATEPIDGVGITPHLRVPAAELEVLDDAGLRKWAEQAFRAP